MDGAKVGVLEEGDEVCLDRLLESADGRALEAEIGLEVLSNLTDKTLEWQLADEKLGRLLVATDLTKSDGTCECMSVVVLVADSEESVRLTWLVSVRLLDTTGRWCGLASLLGGKLLTWGLATSGLACDGMLARGCWRCVVWVGCVVIKARRNVVRKVRWREAEVTRCDDIMRRRR